MGLDTDLHLDMCLPSLQMVRYTTHLSSLNSQFKLSAAQFLHAGKHNHGNFSEICKLMTPAAGCGVPIEEVVQLAAVLRGHLLNAAVLQVMSTVPLSASAATARLAAF